MDSKLIAKKWLASNVVSDELKNEIKNMDDATLEDAFYRDLEFATAGLRGTMGAGTNRMNEIVVAKATLGYARYLLKEYPDVKEKGVVIAHDNRMFGEEFSQAAASVLANNGIRVYLFDSLRATPQLSFAVRYLGCKGGINITASHNPKEYNGYKIYNEDGCQCIVSQSDKVLEEISKIDDELSIDRTYDKSLVTVLGKDVEEAYYKMVIDTTIRKDVDRKNIRVVYTPQHGAGYTPVMTVLKRLGYEVIDVKEQAFPSKTFENTKSPNPEVPAAYELGIEYAKKYNADIVVATDPDSDRLGVVCFAKDGSPILMTGNQTACVQTDYILSSKKELGILPEKSVIYNTIVTTPLGGIISASYGVPTIPVLTGFKNIGNAIKNDLLNNGPVFQMGYEESYGSLLNASVRDKDAVQAVMNICEMTAFYKKQGKTLFDVYEELEKRFYAFADSQYSYQAPGISGAAKIKDLMKKFREENIDNVAGYKVKTKEDYMKLERTTDGVITHFEFDKSDVIKYIFEDQSFIAIRPSGTEPKCKFYFLIGASTKEEAIEKSNKIKEEILKMVE